jgi:hypothetical protein
MEEYALIEMNKVYKSCLFIMFLVPLCVSWSAIGPRILIQQ